MTMTCRTIALLAGASMLAACSVGPDYHRPTVDTPGSFDATLASAETAWPAQGWWANFNSPELNGLINRSRIYNNDLNAAVARVIQADAQVRVSGAPLLPTVEGTASGSYNRTGIGSRRGSTSLDNGFGTNIGSSGSNYFDSRSYSVGLQASYDLDLFGKQPRICSNPLRRRPQSRPGSTRPPWHSRSRARSASTLLPGARRAGPAARRRAQPAQLRGDPRRLSRAIERRHRKACLDVSQQEALVAGRARQPAGLSATRSSRTAIALGILVGLPPERFDDRGRLARGAAGADGRPRPAERAARAPPRRGRLRRRRCVAQNANLRAARAVVLPGASRLTASGGLTSSGALSALTGPGTLVAPILAPR